MLNCEGWQDTSQLPHSWQDLKSGAGAAEDKTAVLFQSASGDLGKPSQRVNAYARKRKQIFWSVSDTIVDSHNEYV